MATQAVEPFADNSSVLSIGALSIENGMQTLLMHGDLEIVRDRKGLKTAKALADFFIRTVQILENDPDLPDILEIDQSPGGIIENPFD